MSLSGELGVCVKGRKFVPKKSDRKVAFFVRFLASDHAFRSWPWRIGQLAYTDSNKPAAPWPPPMHMVTTPYFLLRRLSSRRIDPV